MGCSMLLIESSVNLRGEKECPKCGALNRFDTANPQAQTFEQPPCRTSPPSSHNLIGGIQA
jgi:phage FluMu protein Com